MPLIDMPLAQLRAFQGLNPCPKDIDEYWDRAIAEMEALGTDCTLVPASFQAPGAKCYDLYFTGVGGARVHAKLVKPTNYEGKRPAVLEFHGYSEDPIPVKGTTQNGHIIRGLSDPDPEKLYFRSVFLDTAQLARIVMAMDDVDETRVGAKGGSQGGALTLACAALTPTLNRAAPSCPFLCDYRRVWEMDLAANAYAELKTYFRYFDPRHEREDEIFTKLGYIDNKNLAHRIRARVLMFTGLMDNICPPSTQFAAYNKITAPKDVKIYPDFAHEGYPDSDEMTMQFMLEM